MVERGQALFVFWGIVTSIGRRQSEMQPITRMSPFRFSAGKGYIRSLYYLSLYLTPKAFGDHAKVLNGVVYGSSWMRVFQAV